MSLIKGRKFFGYSTVGLIIILSLLVSTTPTREKFDKWVLQEHQINCEIDITIGNVCYKDERKIVSRSSHFMNAALFASYEQNFKYENGERDTIRTLGVLGILFKMQKGVLWEILN